MKRRPRLAFFAAMLLSMAIGGWRDVATASSGHIVPEKLLVDPELARADYIEHCAGCHGVKGNSAPARLPELRGRVGWFMCTPAARAYLLRLPNIAHSRISDNAQLADMMNYVVFVLGEGSAPPGAAPYTEEDVTRERPRVLSTAALTVERARYVKEAIAKCGAPASLRLLYPGQVQ